MINSDVPIAEWVRNVGGSPAVDDPEKPQPDPQPDPGPDPHKPDSDEPKPVDPQPEANAIIDVEGGNIPATVVSGAVQTVDSTDSGSGLPAPSSSTEIGPSIITQ